MTDVDILNRRFGECLGRPNGTDPRFAWKHSTELHYYFRMEAHNDWQRRCWADRIGKAWVLCQWSPPTMTLMGVEFEVTREQWFRTFGWSRPYPAGGEYKPYAETALKDGRRPGAEETQFYIFTLGQQLEQSEQAHKQNRAGREDDTLVKCEQEAQKVVDDHEKQFYDSVADWEPESWKHGVPHESGDRGGSYLPQAGIGDSPVSGKVGA
jgi:hypothetical protein